ncbi:MAG: T9SS type A sorting domain-containing protein [Crocinitomicaceae bacterium]|nr:T9SS type A sorting domain-containing protein [Crocinitomicaceae bacterium]
MQSNSHYFLLGLFTLFFNEITSFSQTQVEVDSLYNQEITRVSVQENLTNGDRILVISTADSIANSRFWEQNTVRYINAQGQIMWDKTLSGWSRISDLTFDNSGKILMVGQALTTTSVEATNIAPDHFFSIALMPNNALDNVVEIPGLEGYNARLSSNTPAKIFCTASSTAWLDYGLVGEFTSMGFSTTNVDTVYDVNMVDVETFEDQSNAIHVVVAANGQEQAIVDGNQIPVPSNQTGYVNYMILYDALLAYQNAHPYPYETFDFHHRVAANDDGFYFFNVENYGTSLLDLTHMIRHFDFNGNEVDSLALDMGIFSFNYDNIELKAFDDKAILIYNKEHASLTDSLRIKLFRGGITLVEELEFRGEISSYQFSGDCTNSFDLSLIINSTINLDDQMTIPDPGQKSLVITQLNIDCNTLQIQEQEDLNLLVYPNPVKDQLFIQSNSKIKEWQLISLMGQIKFKGSADFVDVSSLESGIYLLQVKEENGIFSSVKIVKD